MITSSRVFLDINLGLGDAIICNGMIRELAKQNVDIAVPVRSRNLPSVSVMFSDIYNVRLWEVSDTCDTGFGVMRDHLDGREVLHVGINHPVFGTMRPFDKQMYALADVPFICRWLSFHVPVNGAEISVPIGRFQLRCAAGSVGKFSLRDIPPYPQVFDMGNVTRRITDWIPWIAEAEGIHCIDSAPLHLVESVPTKGKLFFHAYARPHDGVPDFAVLRKDWTVLQ